MLNDRGNEQRELGLLVLMATDQQQPSPARNGSENVGC
jgi:hypothetical protein